MVLRAVCACGQVRAFCLFSSHCPFAKKLLNTFYKLGAVLGAGETEMCPRGRQTSTITAGVGGGGVLNEGWAIAGGFPTDSV